ncbi:sulfite exporter TauE/SafE family protein [Candidatus Pelagibacter sp.]|nr:sulfite exporter TauE/SafE family protein [Candidatus Pelagibacter sp.]
MENINFNEIVNLLAVLAMAAAVAGFMAGLLGVGGGIIMVPALYYAFSVLDFDIVTRMHLAVGTSLAIIIPTSVVSTKTHMEYDAVDFKMVKSFGIFILFGVIAGTFFGSKFKNSSVSIIFFNICLYGRIIFYFFKGKAC